MANIPTRLNNPGDIKNTATGTFNTYGSPQAGFDALKNDLNIKISGKSKTGIKPTSSLRDFASVWAPDSDGNNSGKYASDLATSLGVTPDTPISALRDRQDDFANAIAKNEGYHGPQVAGMEASTSPVSTISYNNTTAQPIKISVSDFAAKIKQKYPQYQNTDDATLVSKIVAKYPQYADKVDMNNTSGSSSTSDTQDSEQPKTLGEKALGVVGSLTGTEQAGEDIGGALAAGSNQKLFDQATAFHNDTMTQILGKIQEAESTGADTTHLKKILQDAIDSTPDIKKFVPDVTNKTATQILSDFGQLGLAVGASAIPGGGSVVGRIAGAAGVGAAGGALNAVSGGSTDAGEIAKQAAVGGTIGAATGGVLEGASAALKGSSEIDKITEAISPKETAAEAKLAMKQGRMTAAKEPGLFTSGKAGEITPSENVQRSAQTIKEQIPGASKMDDPTLFNAIDDRIGTIARDLRPQMQAVKVKPEALEKVANEWETVKADQLGETSLASEEANIKKQQGYFEQRLLKINSNSNLEDVWDARVDYDNSVPTSVKKATSLSSDSQQTAKRIWLQNRAVMNEMINDLETGLGETSKKAFSDMSDMYTAQNGLMTKAKDSLKVKPSKITQWILRNPVKSSIVGASIGTSVTTGIAKKVIGL